MQNVIDHLVAKQAEIRAKQDDKGFTLIELLVVVVIIGVLVAIAVPVYLNYREGAADKSAQSDVRGAISAVEQYYTSNSNSYPATTLTSINGTTTNPTVPLSTVAGSGSINVSEKTQLTYVNNAVNGTYAICARNKGGSGKVYVYKSATGGSVQTISGADVTANGCTGVTP